ncbi:hypothetical protein BS47DRAFT_1402835 [Hydnum rufescens UP504]|uniref:Uncharacterized protein n=1 Tax=Hydnum rufescens UP504 TaxID=1448309 RepID=A0A9P6DFU1_9AGAM|nr:hypothetical protein BS47DRAFT_1402835 [Hydnum rufescens UP504]
MTEAQRDIQCKKCYNKRLVKVQKLGEECEQRDEAHRVAVEQEKLNAEAVVKAAMERMNISHPMSPHVSLVSDISHPLLPNAPDANAPNLSPRNSPHNSPCDSPRHSHNSPCSSPHDSPTALTILLAVLLTLLLTIPPSLLPVFLLSLWLLSSLSMLALLIYLIHNVLAAIHRVQAEHPRMLTQNLHNIICRALEVTPGCITPALPPRAPCADRARGIQYHEDPFRAPSHHSRVTLKAIGVPQVPTIDRLGFEMITKMNVSCAYGRDHQARPSQHHSYAGSLWTPYEDS